MSTTAKTREILIEGRDGKRIVGGIPANAKITYGPVQPGKAGYGSDNALRIYTSANNQLAVFLNVISFRDLSLTVKVEKVTKNGESSSEHGPKGSKSESRSETSVVWEDA